MPVLRWKFDPFLKRCLVILNLGYHLWWTKFEFASEGTERDLEFLFVLRERPVFADGVGVSSVHQTKSVFPIR